MSDRRPKTLKLGPQFRALSFARDAVNAEARTVLVSFSSEEPVARYYGNEVLDHSPSGCDLSRLNNGAPLLCQHDPDDQIGVVESAYIKDGRGYATLRFSKSEDGEAAFQDVSDGIRTKISVGYRVEAVQLEAVTDGLETYRVTRWQPYEISLVSIPADDTVGVGRAGSEPTQEITPTISHDMKRLLLDANAPEGGNGPAAPPKIQFDENAARANIRKDEQKRSGEILAIASKFNIPTEDSQRFISEGKSVDEFRAHVLESRGALKPVVAQSPAIGMTEKEVKRFSLLSAVRGMIKGGKLEGFEAETCEAARAHLKRELPNERTFVLPEEVTQYQRGLALQDSFTRAGNVGTATAGGFLVQSQYGPVIDYLRNSTALGKLGITILDGIVGDLIFPTQTGGCTAYWVSETGSLTDSQATFAQKKMVPHRVGASYPFTMQLLAQSSISVDAFVRRELDTVIALKKDLAGLLGTGVGGEPLGLANTTGINATVTYGGAATWADIVEHETGISVDNADIGTMGFLIDAATVGKWKTILKDSVAGAGYLMEGMTANGYPVQRSNQVSTAHQSYFGVWSQLLYAGWAGREVTVDSITLAKSGQHQIIINELCDFLVRQPLAFNVSTDSAAQ
jgi:HK97 family phage major capsid protein/HK97 family phage prohead protease